MGEWTPPDIAPPERGHRRIVCAAMQLSDGTLVIGPRHWDNTMHAQVGLRDRKRIAGDEKETGGFIDQWGRFMNRSEAWKVAFAAGQILYRCGGDDYNGGTLYSENLY